MGTLKINGLRACLALMVLIFGVFMVVKAMEKKENTPIDNLVKKVEVQTWYYQSNSTSASAINNPENYALTKPAGANCGTGPVVCSIKDEADPSNSDQPALSHGNVSSNPSAYSRNMRTAF